MKTRGLVTALTITAFSLLAPTQRPAAQAPQDSTRGQSVTVMPDGRWLLIGGGSAGAGASFFDPHTGATVAVSGHMQTPRVGHSATLLPDGTVLVVGGRNGDALVETPELFEPALGRFTPVPIVGAMARAEHTATLLTDGRIVVAGGTNGSTNALPVEIWDVTTHGVSASAATVDRVGHMATLQPDGRVLLSGGRSLTATVASSALAIDADTGAVQRTGDPANQRVAPKLAASMPTNGAINVPLDTRLALRFSTALEMSSLNANTITLRGLEGQVDARVIGAEGGRLAFLWPAAPLSDGATYTLAINGAVDAFGNQIAPASTTFTTQSRATNSADQVDPEEWIPSPSSARDGWRTNRPPSPWESLPPLAAPPGVTAISGRVLTLDGRPLPDVTLELEDSDATTRTDRTGRFLLLAPAASTGHTILHIDGATVHRPGSTYGFFEYGMTVTRSETTVLPFTIWMPKLDTKHVVPVPSPTTTEVAVTTPWIPGLEVHLPAGTHLIGRENQPVTQLGITPIPVDRPPFPLAANIDVPVYFTVQPGSTYVQTDGPGPKGAWVVYPNYRDGVPGQLYQFFHYDPDGKGWYVYGTGTVTRNGAQVAPAARTRVYEFTGAMINGSDSAPAAGAKPGVKPQGDPVDPATGVFVFQKTDLYLPDVIPLAFTRTYQSADGVPRALGFNTTHRYAMFLWSANQYQEADLFLPDGGKIHYVRTSPGTGYADAVFEHNTTPTKFYKSTISHNFNTPGGEWDLRLVDGTVYVFADNAPLQAIRDRYGNTVTIEHSQGAVGNVTRVTSPNGRWLSFTYDSSTPKNRITQVKDNTGRSVTYTYDSSGNLSTVTDSENNITTYTYDNEHRLISIQDGRNIVFLTNEYTNGRLAKQSFADPTQFYQFSYTTDTAGNVTQTDITDPMGHTKRMTFNGDSYPTSEIEALGTPQARTTSYERFLGSNLISAINDGLNRRTELRYTNTGRTQSVTRLANTADMVTTTFTYEPVFNQLATITDPLHHVWTLSYNAAGNITGIRDPLNHSKTVEINSAGQVTSITDALSHEWHFAYAGGDLTSATDPLSVTTSWFVDAAGRRVAKTDPLGRVTRFTPDRLNRLVNTTDGLGSQTSFEYDANSRLTSVTDALLHSTNYTYDAFDRIATRTDPMNVTERYDYDADNKLIQTTDRKDQVTLREYDALDRLTQITFADNSTVTYSYDPGDRVVQVLDSANGTIAMSYDGLNRLTQEVTPQGTVDYTYDADGRRATMTVTGQAQVRYTYDDVHRLITIAQGDASVRLTYDDTDRRATVMYPNGIVATYGYDAASHLKSLTYTIGTTTIGDLTYGYDAAGNRTSVSGSWARTGIPVPLASATYDAADRIITWNGMSFSYDLNGNLTSDGTNTYSWNVRDQLTQLSGGMAASYAYDGIGRRRAKTVGGITTAFLYDEMNIVQELTTGGTPTANLLTGLGLDETFTRNDAFGTNSIVVDALESTLALADSTGVIQTQYTYGPFGSTTASGAASSNPTQFTGRENDGNGLYSYRFRYYSSTLQRFISEDPLGFVPDANLYGYVTNNPTNLWDPLGLHFTDYVLPNWLASRLPWRWIPTVCQGDLFGFLGLHDEGAGGFLLGDLRFGWWGKSGFKFTTGRLYEASFGPGGFGLVFDGKGRPSEYLGFIEPAEVPALGGAGPLGAISSDGEVSVGGFGGIYSGLIHGGVGITFTINSVATCAAR